MRSILFLAGSLLRTLALTVQLLLHRRVPWILKLLPIAAFLYLILPIDVIPDIIPLLGFADDLLALFLGLSIFLRLAPRYTQEGSRPRHARRPASHRIIEGSYQVLDDDQKHSPENQ